MREPIAFTIEEGKKRELESIADNFDLSTSAVTAAFVEAGVAAFKESEEQIDDFLAEYLDDRQVGRPVNIEEG